MAIDAHMHELKAMIHKLWMMKVKPKPQRHTAVWSTTSDRVEKLRSEVVRRALITDGIAADWTVLRSGAYTVRSSAFSDLTRTFCIKVTVESLRNYDISNSFANVA